MTAKPDIERAQEPAALDEAQVYDHLELLSEMGQDFASTRDINASLMRAVDHITRYIGAEGGALFMLEDEGRQLVCRACVGATEITGRAVPADLAKR